MFGLQMLDVAIGLISVYLVLALACTAFMEAVSGLADRRGRNLAAGIFNLLRDKQLVKTFYKHPLILSMREDGTPPSYIPPQIFAATVVDRLVPATSNIQEIAAADPGAAPPPRGSPFCALSRR